MEKIELLAPAGDLERCKTAIRYGADAVYLGGKRFSLRSRASNFDISDIEQACKFANEHNARIHVTVNIIPHNEDLDGIEEYLRQLEEVGVTAIIVASVNFIKIAKKVAPKLEVHLSTQMSTLNSACIEEYASWGVDRVVLGRECTMDTIRKIAAVSSKPIEAFIHGGMCSNYSGRCTLSNAMTLRDANRGGCAQSCRWKYHLMDKDQELSDPEYLLSMSSKDLQASRFIKDMIDANVASLKIEGRMKSNYYIATVVKTYRKLIDEVYAGHDITSERLAYYQNEFNKAENRPTCTGFLDGTPTEDSHLYGINGAGVTHEFVGYIKSYDATNKTCVCEVRNYFVSGDELEVFGPSIDNEHFICNDMKNSDGELVEIANKPMQLLTIKVPFEVHEHDMIRKVGKNSGNI